MALPTFVATGAQSFGTGDGTPGIPAGTQADDLLLLFAETADQAITNPDSGVWTEAPSSPANRGGSTRCTVFYAWQTSGGISAPTVPDPGDHIVCVIAAFRGVHTSSPFNASASGGSVSTSNLVSSPTVTTTVADCLIVGGDTTSRDQTSTTFHSTTITNANLANNTQRYQQGRADGNGGSLQIWTGEKASAGVVGATTISLGNNNEVWTAITLALAPTSADVSVNAGLASGTGTTNTTWALVAPNAEAATGTGAASNATPSVGAYATEAAGSGSAHTTSAHVQAPIEPASGTGTAYDATVSLATNVNATADVAAGTGAANDATNAVAASSGAAAGTGASGDAAGAVAVNAEASAGTGAAYDATVAATPYVSANADVATGSGAANSASINVAPNAGVGSGAGSAFDATVDTAPGLFVRVSGFGIDAQILGIGMPDRIDFHYGVQPDTAITYEGEVLDVVLARLFETVGTVTDPNTFRLYAYIADYVPTGSTFGIDAYLFGGYPLTLDAVIHKIQKVNFGISAAVATAAPWNVVRVPTGGGVATYTAISGLNPASIHDGVRDGGFFKTWASGDWYQINWTVPQTINQVHLYDTTTDAVTSSGYFGSSGELQFSDGSVVSWSGLPDQGYQGFSGVQEIPPFHPLVIDFAPRMVSSMRVVSLVGGHTRAGLAEIEAYNTDQYT